MIKKLGWRKPVSYVASVLAAMLAVTAVFWALFIDHEFHDLRLKLRPGEVIRHRTTMRMGSTGKETFHSYLNRYTVGSVSPEGVAEITSLQEQMTVREGGPEGPVTWDSTSGAPIPKDYGIAGAAVMTGIPMRYRVNSQGTILWMEGWEETKKRFRDTIGGEGFFGAMMTDAPFSSEGGTLMGPPLPRSPVKKGGKWFQETRSGTAALGKSRHVQEYCLKEVRNGIATIVLVGTKTVQESPGEVSKAFGIKDTPDPNQASGVEEVSTFSIAEGMLKHQNGRSWTQSTLSNGKLFRFESSNETTLIERRAGP